MELKVIDLKGRNVIGEAKIYVPKEWFISDRTRDEIDEVKTVKVYEGDVSRPAIPVWQVEYQFDWDYVVGMALGIEIPEELVFEIKIGRPVWRTEYWNDDGYRVKENFYYKEEFDDYMKDHPDAGWFKTIEYDEWSPKAGEYRSDVDPAFSTTFTSGERFSTKEEAEAWGMEHFGDEYAGVEQVSFSKDPKSNIKFRQDTDGDWKWCGEMHSHCEKENDCYDCPYGLHS